MIKSIRISLLYLVDLVFAVIEFILCIRLLLKLFGASTSAPFVNWIYTNTSGLLHPFEGAFPTTILKGGFVIEFSVLLALIVYGIIGYMLIIFLSETFPRNQAV